MSILHSVALSLSIAFSMGIVSIFEQLFQEHRIMVLLKTMIFYGATTYVMALFFLWLYQS